MRRSILSFGTLLVAASLSCDGKTSEDPKAATPRMGASDTALPPDDKIVGGQTLYIPIYSHVYTADSANPLNLAATLFVRNTDPNVAIVITRVEYFDSGGKLLRSFLKGPLKLDPMASIDYFLKESDVTGGPSPSFLVDWVSTGKVSAPVVESVMIGTSGSQGISLNCPSRVVRERKP